MDIIRKELFYVNDPAKRKKVEVILSVGESVGFLKTIDAGVFKIVSRFKTDKSLEKDLKRKYIRYTERKQFKQAIEEANSEAEKEIREEMEKISLKKWLE